jgi:hypothetical protein
MPLVAKIVIRKAIRADKEWAHVIGAHKFLPLRDMLGGEHWQNLIYIGCHSGWLDFMAD